MGNYKQSFPLRGFLKVKQEAVLDFFRRFLSQIPSSFQFIHFYIIYSFWPQERIYIVLQQYATNKSQINC